MVERKRLLDRLSKGREMRLIVISGVAGSGKTSLAAQWVARDHLRIAWYSLDKTDNEADLFIRYLLATLSLADSRLASLISVDMREGRAFSTREVILRIADHASDLAGDLYLVLDDYQFVTAQTIHDTVSDLLNVMPSNMHVVILTRYSIPFPLSPFRVKNHIVEIPAPEMRFTEAETEQFFSDIIPLKLATSETREVVRNMEGWIGGLQLLGLSLTGKDAPEDLGDVVGRSSRQVWDYLIDEVITVQPEPVRRFLEATAPLDRFNAEIAADLTDMEDAAGVLDTIRRNNLFLVPLDGGRKWYRYHHLLSEAVRERMKTSSPEKLRRLHQQAALWFARHGYLEDAFRSAFASDDPDFSADLLEDYLLFINERYEYASGRRWLSKLPNEVLMERALLRLHDCGQKVESFRLRDVEAAISDIEADKEAAFSRYSGHRRRLCEDLFIYFKHVLCYYYRDPAHADLEELENAYRAISPENGVFSGYIKILVALYHIAQADPVKADLALQDASSLIISSGIAVARVLWFRFAATVQRMQGRLYRSEAVLNQAFEFLQEKGLSETPLRYLLYIPVAWLHYQRNETDEAAKYATAAAAYGEHVGFARDSMEGNILLGLISLAKGEIEQAEHSLRRARLAAEEPGVSDASVHVDAWLALLSLAEGNNLQAAEWSRQNRVLFNEPLSGRLIQNAMIHAELLMRQGLYRKADSLLLRLRRICMDRNMKEAVLDVDIVHSAALFAENKVDRAQRIMKNALSFAEGEGYVQPFVRHQASILPLLNGLKDSDLGLRQSSYVKTILAECGIADRTPSRPKSSRENDEMELTVRELEVLRLAAAGSRYKEIAQETSVSVETVKTHMKHVFEKLDVHSRAKAVRRARDLQLPID